MTNFDLAETWVLVDVETDGPLPGKNSMLALAAVAFKSDGAVIGDFYQNILELPESSPHPETSKWWSSQPEAWSMIREDPQEPKKVMKNFESFLKGLPAKPILISHPASFDFSFVHWYSLVFLNRLPFFSAGLDIGSFAMSVLKTPYSKSSRQYWPAELNLTKHKHSHHPLADAYGHMEAFVNLLRFSKFNDSGSPP